MRKGKGRWSALVLSLSLAVLATGVTACVEDVGLIDRTQPNKVPKAIFAGQWYNVQTVVDIPPSSAFTFIGETYAGPVFAAASRVIFDITEKELIVYPVFEYVEGSEREHAVWRKIRNYWKTDENGDIVDEFIDVYTGNPVAVFEIESHFDVQREYSTATGEENNVLEENTTDRKWWQRRYVRVNWAKNKLVDFGFTAGYIEAQGVDYYVQDWEEESPDRPVLTDDLIMITTKLFAQPTSFEACEAIQGGPLAADVDCAGAVVKVRNAFRKVPLNDDYVALRHHVNEEQEKFGFFQTDRYDYDDSYGVTFEGKINLINRWNIWDKSRKVVLRFDINDIGQELVPGEDGVEHEALVPCMNEGDCKGVADGSGREANHCWQEAWFEPGHCIRWEIIPVHERPLRPIIYHLSAVFPEQLLDEAYQLAGEYTQALGRAVAWARYWDERDMLHPKACATNADCFNSDGNGLIDVTFEDDVKTIACDETKPAGDAANQTCGTMPNSVCAGYTCMQRTPCSATSPCDKGQTCVAVGAEGNFCAAAGSATEVRTPFELPEAINVVLYKDGETTKSLMIYGEETRAGNENKALVRFVHASPGVGPAMLYATDPAGAAVALNQVLDPASGQMVDAPADFNENVSSLRYFEVTPDTYSMLSVKAGGADAATRSYVSFEAGHSYLVVFSGGSSVAVYDHVLTGQNVTGVRVVHAMADEAEVDVGFNSARRAQLDYREASEYMDTSRRPHQQRLTVVRAAGNGNVTCYYYEGNGQCVGWKPELNDTIRATVKANQAALDPLFVVCTNVYSGDDCPDLNGDGKPDYGDQSVHNDCRYSKENGDGTISNPCKDRVPDYNRQKLHGDTRYNFLYWIPEDQAASPLGYGPSAGDPFTGEIVYGIAHVYGAPMETYGTYARDLLWLVNGMDDDGNPFTMDDVITSSYIRDYVKKFKSSEYGKVTGALSARSRGELDEVPSAAEALSLRTVRGADRLPPALRYAMARQSPVPYHNPQSNPDIEREIRELDVAIQQGLAKGRAVFGERPGNDRLQRIRGTYIEDLMINEEVKLGLTGGRAGDNDSLNDQDRRALSPASWMTMASRQKEDRRLRNLMDHNIMVGDFADDSLWALAHKLGCDDPSEVETTNYYEPCLGGGPGCATSYCLKGENLRWGVMARMFGGTLEHEVGHTVGLRHNFSASTDVMNFQDEYYKIREREGVACISSVWCEPGETCANMTCTADADCHMGTFCDATTGTCQDIYERVYGQCVRATMVRTDCETDGDCGGDPKLVACVEKECAERIWCAEGASCREGDTCGTDGYCYDEADQLVSLPIETQQDVPVRKLVPRPAPTASEIAGNRMEYQYASLMDYGGGINFDTHGLGKYDRAALLFGYGEMVETYQDISHFDRAIEDAARTYGRQPYQFGWYKDTTYWRYGGTTTHPFGNINDSVGIEQNLLRDPSPWRQVKLERQMITKDFLRDAYDSTWVEATYKMCSDEYRGQLTEGGCYYFDLGADILEIIYHSMVKLREYYIFDAFKNEAYRSGYGGDPNRYFQRILDRWLRPLGDAGMYFGLYAGYFTLLDYLDVWRNSAMSGYLLDSATRLALQSLTELIASPAPGQYRLNAGGDSWENISYEPLPETQLGPGETNIDLGTGKYPYTTYLDDENYGDAGYWRHYHALWIGAFWEKMAALLTLTDSRANFMSDYVGEQLDVGVGTSVGFNTAYPGLLGNFLGGVVAGAPEYCDGYIDPANGVFKPRNVLDADDASIALPTVANGINGLTMKLYSAVYGLAYMPAGFDPSFIDSLAVTIKGNGSEYELGSGVDTVEFTDPFGHKTYIAHASNYDYDDPTTDDTNRSPFDDVPRLDSAYRVIEQANAAVAAYDAATTDADRARWGAQIKDHVLTLDVLRTLNELFGDITY